MPEGRGALETVSFLRPIEENRVWCCAHQKAIGFEYPNGLCKACFWLTQVFEYVEDGHHISFPPRKGSRWTSARASSGLRSGSCSSA